MLEQDPNQVKIFDTTLRDGDQTPGVNFGIQEKEDIARKLADAGVDIIEAGFPFAEEGDFEAVRNIAENVAGPIIVGLSRTGPEDIEAAWGAIEPAKDKGGARIHTFIATSEIHMRDKLKMTPDEVLDSAINAVKLARTFTDDVEFSPEDASRSDFDFMMKVILAAVENGATTINIPDTVGYAHPDEYAARIQKAKSIIEERFGKDTVVISAHCHDDLGMATANSIAAVNAGARQVEVAVNGLGERAGNTSLEQFVANIQEKGGGLWTSVDTKKLASLSRFVAIKSGVTVLPNSAIVGANAFAHESGIHQDGVSNNVKTYEHMQAENYGQESTMKIGKLSGKAGIESRLKDLGFAVDPKALYSVRTEAKKQASMIGRALTDTEIESIFANHIGEVIEDSLRILDIKVSGETVSISLDNDGQVMTESNSSDKGSIDGGVKAINKILEFSGDILNWHGDSMTQGSDSTARVEVTIKNNGDTISATAEDPSVDGASILAYINAINLHMRIEQRRSSKHAANT